MRVTIPSGSVRVGNIKLYDTFKITEMDAGHLEHTVDARFTRPRYGFPHIKFSQKDLSDIESQLATVIPCKEEEAHLLEAVLRGVPNACLIILVSGSQDDGSEDSMFATERKLLSQVCYENARPGIIVHQRDEGLAEAFAASGMSEFIRQTQRDQLEENSVKSIPEGKTEALIVGVAVAKLVSKKFVGFIHVKNQCSGAVHECCKAFAAGLHYALHCTGLSSSTPSIQDSPLVTECQAMVRVQTNVNKALQHPVNKWLNKLISSVTNMVPDSGMITTGNSSESAMSIELAMQLQFAAGLAVEPYQLVNMFEKFQSVYRSDEGSNTDMEDSLDSTSTDDSSTYSDMSMEESHGWEDLGASASLDAVSESLIDPPAASWFVPKARIIQIQTCTSYEHASSESDEHFENVQIQGLSAIYHSHLTSNSLRDMLRRYMGNNFLASVDQNGEPGEISVYPPLATLDMDAFKSEVDARATTLEALGPSADLLT